MTYASKDYMNPFFRHKKNAIKLDPLRITVLAVSAVLIGGSIYILYSQQFKIKTIEISGQQQISKEFLESTAWEEVRKNRFSLYPKGNIFIFNTSNIKDAIAKSFNLDAIEIAKDYPSKLTIRITERKPAAVWVEDDKYYYIDAQGSVINEVNALDVDSNAYAIIKNSTDKKIADKSIKAETSYIEQSTRLFQLFSAEKADFQLKNLEIKDDYLLSAILVNGPEINFNTNNDIIKQFDKLVILKKEKLKDDFFKKVYVDVGIGDTIYTR